MKHTASSVQELYPIRYWLTLAYLVGVPNFVHFDTTGRTHEYGLFNLTSISDIALTLLAAASVVVVTLLSRRRILMRKIDFAAWVWVALLGMLILASVLQPPARLTAISPTDLPLSLFRLGQWVLAFVLILSLYSRAREDDAHRMIVQLIARTCWINIALVWIVLPLAPSLVYVSEDDTADSASRLGGIMIHPGHVSLLASVAFFHAMLFLRGPRRLIAFAASLVTLALAYTRGAEVIFVLTLCAYMILLARKPIVRWAGAVAVGTAGCVSLLFQDAILSYLSRGQQASDVASFSGRTIIWDAGMQAAEQRPFLGYGYIAGARNALHDYWPLVHWLPPHAHNDLVQAFLSGGILSVILVTWIYGYVLWLGIQGARSRQTTTFFLLIWIELVATAFVSTNIMSQFTRMGSLFVPCFVALVAQRKDSASAAGNDSGARYGSGLDPAMVQR